MSAFIVTINFIGRLNGAKVTPECERKVLPPNDQSENYQTEDTRSRPELGLCLGWKGQ